MDTARMAHLEIHLKEPDSGEWLFDKLGGNECDADNILYQFKGRGWFDIYYLRIYFNICPKYEACGDFEILPDGLMIEGELEKSRFGEFSEEAFKGMVEELDEQLDYDHHLAKVHFWIVKENGEREMELVQDQFDF